MTKPPARNKEPAPYEAVLHEEVANFLNVALPDDAEWWHTPNEGKRGWNAQRAFKKLGGKKGMLDILILWRGRLIVIELKRRGEKPTPEQARMMERLTLCGALSAWFDNFDAFEAFLSSTIPLKARAV